MVGKNSSLRGIIIELNAGDDLDMLVSDYLMKGNLEHYSTDISKAWGLLDTLRNKGIHISVECLFDSYRVSWHYEDLYTKTAEEGICKIALLSTLDV